MRNPPHRLMSGLRLTGHLTKICPLFPMHYMYAMYFLNTPI